MKRKKMNIFFPILIAGGTGFALSTFFVTNHQKLKDVVYSSKNLIIHIAKKGNGKKLVVLGSGYSLSIDKKNHIVKHDPVMIFPSMNPYEEDVTVLSFYFPFETGGLEVAGKELSDFLNEYVSKYEDVTLIGHSKCGVCIANMVRWLKRKVNIITISTPFQGTPVVNKQEFGKNLSWLERKIYTFIFSDHVVDRNIAIDSDFIKNTDYSGLKEHFHLNIISVCPSRATNPLEFFLKIIDKKGKVEGDGIVSEISQRLDMDGSFQEKILAVHATSLKKGIDVSKRYM